MLLFLGWQNWYNSLVLAGQQNSAAAQQSQAWLSDPQPPPPAAKPAEPPVMAPVAAAQPFAVIYIPRLGSDWKRIIRETVDVKTVLNSFDAGVGHYPGTQMPGEVGNFAIAGHDSGWGNTFIDLSKLQIGDEIYIQTKDRLVHVRLQEFPVRPAQGRRRSAARSRPSGNAAAQDRLITITTCNPPFHAAERLIAYGSFQSWQPPTDIPAPIASIVNAQN